MKRYYLLSVIMVMLLTGCSNEVSDYELRLVENNNKFTINPSPSIVASTVVDESQNNEFGKFEEETIIIPDYNEGLDDSIVVEEDVIKADIEKQQNAQNELEDDIEQTDETAITTETECVYSQAEHTFSQTLINYVGKGNYEKWIANAKPTCENGLTIYDYMDNFNMTKSFFVNLTAYDSTYTNVNVYAH